MSGDRPQPIELHFLTDGGQRPYRQHAPRDERLGEQHPSAAITGRQWITGGDGVIIEH
jgi:hypothetical protein